MPDVFISYVEEDGRIAQEIAHGLQASGYSTWHYEEDGLPGTDYLETIGGVIDSAGAFVIIISQKSVQSPQVYRELVRAAENEKAMFPLLHGIKHEEFQERSPKWRQALGATTSIGIPPAGVAAIMPRLLAGLQKRGILPSGAAGGPETGIPPLGAARIPVEPARNRSGRALPIWAVAGLVLLAVAAAVGITLALTRGAGPPGTSPTVAGQATAAVTETPAPIATPQAAVPVAQATQPVPSTSTSQLVPPATPGPSSTPMPEPTAAPTLDLHATQVQLLDGPYARHISWSPDGKTIAVGASDLFFLDAETYQEVYRIGSVQWPGGLAFSPDGNTLAYSGEQVTFVKVGTWGDLGTLAGSGDAEALAYSPDGKTLAAAIGEVVKVWDLPTGKETRTLPGTSGRALAFSPDGKMLVATGGMAGQEIKRWDVETGEELAALTGHTNWINALAFSPDGQMLASGSVDQSVRLWDATTGRQLMVLTGHTGEITSLALSPDNRLLASASWDLSVRLWDVATGSKVQSLLGHTGRVECVAFSPDGSLLASGSQDGMRLWSIESTSVPAEATPAGAIPPAPTSSAENAISPGNAARVKIWKTLDATGDQATWSPDGKWLGISASDALLYDAISLEQARTIMTELSPGEIAFSPDGKTVAVLVDGVTLYAPDSGGELYTLFKTGTIRSAMCSSFLAFSPNSATLAAVDGDVVRLFDVATGRETNTLVAKGAVSVAFSSDGNNLFAGSWEGIVVLDVANGQVVRTFGEASRGAECLAMSADGALLASAGMSNDSVILWDPAGGRQLLTFAGHKEGVLELAFSPDGSILASSGRDVTIRLWDVATGSQLCSLIGHAEPAESLAFSPDGVTLSSAGRDGSVRLWRVTP